jgi:peptidyl-prolyl cis-trans isomerase A (cyclophilin A)
MRILLIYLLVIILFSCEDNKKASVAKTPEPSIEKKDTIHANEIENQEKRKDVSEAQSNNKYSKITNNNVVEFLTQYGNDNPENKVRITTIHGNIEIELYNDTPLHRANFIYLIKEKYFNETFFHRVVPNFIIQGGNSDNRSAHKKRYNIGHQYLLPAEINGRNHTYGSVSGAKTYRENPDHQSFPFEFFIFLGPSTSTSHLDGRYTVFGKVTKGMTVVEKISKLAADERDWPLENLFITVEVLN